MKTAPNNPDDLAKGSSAVELPAHVQRSGLGPAVVLLHCLGVNGRFWEYVAPVNDRGDDLVTALSHDFTVLRYDFPGHGVAKSASSQYSIEDLADQLAAVLDAEGFDTASVVGISLGGVVAQSFAARYSHRVEKLALIDTTPRYSPELRGMWHQRARTAQTEGVGALVTGLMNVWFSSAFAHSDSTAVRYVRDTLQQLDGEAYAKACIALAQADLRGEMERITANTLVVCGTEDIPSFIESAIGFLRTLKNAKLVWLEGARHASILEAPRPFWDNLLVHLASTEHAGDSLKRLPRAEP